MSKHTSNYKVAAASCYVTVPGVGSVLLYRDAPVPDSVEDDLDRLVADGFLVEVEDGEVGGHPSDLPPDSEPADPVGPADPAGSDDVDGDGPTPPKSADKATWVAYAVTQGATEDDANALTKDQLIEQYGTKPAS
jgi:hypothetical protein